MADDPAFHPTISGIDRDWSADTVGLLLGAASDNRWSWPDHIVVIQLPSLPRLAVGGALLGGYQILSDTVWMGRVTGTSSWCEIEGTLGWAAMLILASVFADWFYSHPQGQRNSLLGSLASLGLGIGLSNWIEISQYFVSASYVLISLGVSGLIFLGFHLLTEKLNIHLTLLIAWGKNPLILYLLHYWIWIYAFIAPLARTWYLHAPIWLIILQAVALLAYLVCWPGSWIVVDG